MAGLQRTRFLLVVAVVPWLLTGCGSARSRLAWNRPADNYYEQTLAQAQRLEQEGRLGEARQLFVQLHRADPNSARYAHRLGVVSLRLGEHEQAAAALQDALSLEPNNPEILADAGHAACLLKNFEEGERLLRKSLTLYPQNPRAKSHLALAVGLQGRIEECEKILREVYGDNEVDILCSLAYVNAHLGDVVAATDLYQQALDIDSNSQRAARGLAVLEARAEENSFAQAAPADVEQAATGTGDSDVALALETRAAEEQAAPESGDDSTGWTETEDPADELPAEVVREFPNDISEDADAEAGPVQTVTTDESPFTIVEAPSVEETTTAEPAAEEAITETPADAESTGDVATAEEAVEQPADEMAATDKALDFIDPWAEETAADEPAQPDLTAQPDLMARIIARNGQTGFMGFCPVTLRDELSLADALPQFTTEYQMQSYQFSSEEAKQKFEADPERYLPAAGGLDVVAVSQGTAVAQGSLEHALWFRHRLYLFLDAENRELFLQQARQFAVD